MKTRQPVSARGTRVLRATIDRLQHQRRNLPRSRGRAAGERWAREDAHVAELLRAAKLEADLGGPATRDDWDWSLNFEPAHDWDVAARLALDLLGLNARKGIEFDLPNIGPRRRRAAQEFWQRALGDQAGEVRDAEFCRGFLEGALAVWHAAERHVEK